MFALSHESTVQLYEFKPRCKNILTWYSYISNLLNENLNFFLYVNLFLVGTEQLLYEVKEWLH